MKINRVAVSGLVGLTTFSFLFLSSSVSFADGVITTTTVNITESCTLTGTTDTTHTATLLNGTYSGTDYTNGIGQTTLKAFCNDAGGFAIYAIGYTNEEYGNTTMHWSGAANASDSTNAINTGIYTSGTTVNSTWSMKLASVAGTYAATIANGTNNTENFTNWHEIPDEYTKVAYRDSGTDIEINGSGTGSSITVTYDAYISAGQPAGSYVGKVKYTLVHPSTEAAPMAPLDPSKLNITNAIIYAPNTSDTDGSMSSLPQTSNLTNAPSQAGAISATPNYTTILIAPNFYRPGYGFAGWSTDFEATSSSTIYGPNEAISTNPQYARGLDVSGGAVLYPVWIAKETNVTMQTFNSTNYSAYNSAPNGTVIALEDERDHEVYAVAKLADGKWWMIENLRLDDSATITTTNTHNPLHDTSNNDIVTLKTDYANNAIATHLAASNSGTWCTSNDASCVDQTMLNTNNTRLSDSSLNPSYSGANNATSKWHGYGNYYNWYSATAGNGTYSFSTNNNSVTGDLCPAGWRLPQGGMAYAEGGTSGVNVTGDTSTYKDFYNLGYALMGSVAYNSQVNSGHAYYGTNVTNANGDTAIKAFRKYPNNFVYSGYWNGAQASLRGIYGYYWSSSANDERYAYYLSFDSSSVYPGTSRSNKYNGRSVRCVAGS